MADSVKSVHQEPFFVFHNKHKVLLKLRKMVIHFVNI